MPRAGFFATPRSVSVHVDLPQMVPLAIRPITISSTAGVPLSNLLNDSAPERAVGNDWFGDVPVVASSDVDLSNRATHDNDGGSATTDDEADRVERTTTSPKPRFPNLPPLPKVSLYSGSIPQHAGATLPPLNPTAPSQAQHNHRSREIDYHYRSPLGQSAYNSSYSAASVSATSSFQAEGDASQPPLHRYETLARSMPALSTSSQWRTSISTSPSAIPVDRFPPYGPLGGGLLPSSTDFLARSLSIPSFDESRRAFPASSTTVSSSHRPYFPTQKPTVELQFGSLPSLPPPRLLHSPSLTSSSSPSTPTITPPVAHSWSPQL
jgi:hypothetical protein